MCYLLLVKIEAQLDLLCFIQPILILYVLLLPILKQSYMLFSLKVFILKVKLLY